MADKNDLAKTPFVSMHILMMANITSCNRSPLYVDDIFLIIGICVSTVPL